MMTARQIEVWVCSDLLWYSLASSRFVNSFKTIEIVPKRTVSQSDVSHHPRPRHLHSTNLLLESLSPEEADQQQQKPRPPMKMYVSGIFLLHQMSIIVIGTIGKSLGNRFQRLQPEHAFPTPYSAKLWSVPYSLDNPIFNLTSRNWMRSPAAHAPRYSSLSVDDLAGLFAQMNMRASAKSPRDSKLTRKQQQFVSPVIVMPPAAPHPAIVNPHYTSPTAVIQTSDSYIWQKSSLRTRKQTMFRSQVSSPSWILPDAPGRRKSPCIARRTPSSPLNTRRYGTNPRNLSSSSSIQHLFQRKPFNFIV